MGLKPFEIVMILLVIMLLFGATRLPQLGSSLGSAIRNFKRGFAGDEEATKEADKKLAGTSDVAGTNSKSQDSNKA